MQFFIKKNLFSYTRGFTLIELVVVIAISAILSAALIFNYSGFGANTALKNLAQDIALQIKQAQTLAISGGYGDVYSYDFSNNITGQAPTYGIWFDLADITVNKDKGFALFVDRPVDASGQYAKSNGILDPADLGSLACTAPGKAGSECLSVSKISSQDHISGLFYKNNSDKKIYPITKDILSITFMRPIPVAHFSSSDPGEASLLSSAEAVYIEIESLRNQSHKYITVLANGQISVTDGCLLESTSIGCPQ